MARFSYGFFGNITRPGITPVGPQTVIGQAGPAGGTVVSITPGSILQTSRPTIVSSPIRTTPPTFFRPAPAPIPAPVAIKPPAPVPVAETGKSTVISTPTGPVQVPVVAAPVPAPMLIAPVPGKPPVMVVPVNQMPPPAPPPAKAPPLPNLPTVPVRVQPKAPRLVDEDTGGLPPGTYDPSEYFPPEIFPRIPPRAGQIDPRARPALTAAVELEFDVQDIFVGGGRADEEGRPFPMTRPAQTATRLPSPTGYVPVRPAMPRVVDVKAETDGTLLVKVPGASPRPVVPLLPKGPTVTRGGGLVGVVAGAGAGFLVGGPVGAGVGAVAVFLLGRK